ncbi:MAG: DUF6145 family protein [Lachnospiraceae bacterium]|nr:DUF6145 family protein [Lachnospiraceae bacterium]
MYEDDFEEEREAFDQDKIICVSSSYERKFYLADKFSGLPEQIKEELQIMCVLFTEDVGGILTMVYDDEGNISFLVTTAAGDFAFDEIGSEYKIRQIQRQKKDFLESLEKYIRVKFMGENIDY